MQGLTAEKIVFPAVVAFYLSEIFSYNYKVLVYF